MLDVWRALYSPGSQYALWFEDLDGPVSALVEREIGEDFTNNTGKLEPVA